MPVPAIQKYFNLNVIRTFLLLQKIYYINRQQPRIKATVLLHRCQVVFFGSRQGPSSFMDLLKDGCGRIRRWLRMKGGYIITLAYWPQKVIIRPWGYGWK